jgi:homoserine kinase type II
VAVFTEVGFADASALVDTLSIGRLTRLEPIQGGIENTNYFCDTTGGRHVLTLFERLSAAELPFYLGLMRHLADKGLPVPGPKANAAGAILHALAGKPAAVVDRLPGEHHLAPDDADCASVGTMLAGLHLAGSDYAPVQPSARGLAWWQATVPRVLPHLAPAQRALMEDELAFQTALAASGAHAALPRGPIHGDLFRDNVLFDGPSLVGVFDFYFAGVDTLLFDVAVALNDWCVDLESGRLIEERAEALVDAYETVRPLEPAEMRLLPALMRAAAFRFWVSRAADLHLPRAALVLVPHDPAHFERVLVQRREAPWHPEHHRAAVDLPPDTDAGALT